MSFTDFGQFAYRAWASRKPLDTGPWEAWYEIHTLNHDTLLSGPKKLPGMFETRQEAFAAADAKARWEIDHSIAGQTRRGWR